MNKNTLLTVGFIILCLSLLYLDSVEGFITVNTDGFLRVCADDNNTTCNISTSGSKGNDCSEPADVANYNVTINNTHSQSFDVDVEGCSDSAELQAPDITPEARPCSHSDTPYTLHGCVSKCNSPGQKVGYNIPESNLPPYISNSNIVDMPGGSCDLEQGYLPAIEVCFNQVDGTITNDRNSASCLTNNGLWYDGTSSNSIKLICGPSRGPNNYSIVGCEQGCLSRINDSEEYTTTSDLNNENNENKELIQLLDREGDTTILKNSTNSPYSLTETNLTPSTDSSFTMFDVTGTPRTVSFKSNISDPSEQGVNVDFGGNVESQSCDLYSEDDNLRRKYHVSGLFPTCDSSYECLNFNIAYDNDGEVPLNIEDLKTKMVAPMSEGDCWGGGYEFVAGAEGGECVKPYSGSDPRLIKLGLREILNKNDWVGWEVKPWDDADHDGAPAAAAAEAEAEAEAKASYKDSLYYYRRYKDSEGKWNIEGQIRCHTDVGNPFHCIISGDEEDANQGAVARQIWLNRNYPTVRYQDGGQACNFAEFGSDNKPTIINSDNTLHIMTDQELDRYVLVTRGDRSDSNFNQFNDLVIEGPPATGHVHGAYEAGQFCAKNPHCKAFTLTPPACRPATAAAAAAAADGTGTACALNADGTSCAGGGDGAACAYSGYSALFFGAEDAQADFSAALDSENKTIHLTGARCYMKH